MVHLKKVRGVQCDEQGEKKEVRLTMEERAKIVRASLEAADAGNAEEELRLLRMLPLAPHLGAF
ncbi:hypothetical protein LJC22_00720 [Desulfosarcina sp. OttesenSCG-928-G10]|nr:hypothetical protein [Desulfosarcina sp. OttesenSCG-928-G10]